MTRIVSFFRTHPRSKWTALTVLGTLGVLVVAISLFDWNSLRPALARKLSALTGRPVSIAGDLKVHPWSWAPTLEVADLTVDNPPWADHRHMFTARRIEVSISLPRLLRGQVVLPRIVVEQPVIDLERDTRGRASWTFGNPSGTPQTNAQPAKLPAVRHLIIEGGQLHVLDRVRKLTFSGSLIASDEAGKHAADAFKIRCTGTLNEKPFRLDADGGPLVDLQPDKPYALKVALAAADIKLDTDVTVRKPFDLGALDIRFVLSGNDLADAFYLTGLALPNTPKYRLAAQLHIDGTTFKVEDLKGLLGASDIAGRGAVETAGQRPKLLAELRSVKLNMVDLAPTLGEPQPARQTTSLAADHAANRQRPARAEVAAATRPLGLLLPDADLQVERVRGMDADVTYRADTVDMPKVPLQKVNFHLKLDAGLLTIDPLSFVLDAGKFVGRVQIDARNDVPVSDIDMHIDAVDLAQFKSATMKQAPLGGTLLGRFKFRGAGSSVHKFAAASDGDVSIVIPHGQISDVIAELTGINVVKGLGLLLAKSDQHTDIRCGIMDFKDRQGKLDSTTVYVDTSNVLITGRGDIDLGSERINLALQGDPKTIRLLRLRSPILLHGTLLHPAVGIQAEKLAAQAGVATALGLLLTPAAAAIAFIDPGLAKDKDCSTVLSQARSGVENPLAGTTPVGRVPPLLPVAAARAAGAGGNNVSP